jgi:hypothetical protein
MTTSLPLAISVLLLASLSPLSAQEWIWVTSESPNTSGTAISHDPFHNIYVTGNFIGTTTFGTQALVSDGAQDIFIARYDPDGKLLWARRIGGTGVDVAKGIEADGFGNSYIAGGFRGTASFGSLSRVSQGAEDLYFGMYDSTGNPKWIVTGGGSGFDRANALTTDLNGNLYVTGIFSGTMTLGDTTVTSSGSSDLFVASYDVNGKRNAFWHWGTAGGSAGGNTIVRRANGNLYVGGSFSGSLIFGSTTLVDSTSNGDGFFVRLSAQGTPLWAKRIGGPGNDYVSNVTSEVNEVTIVGGFHGTARIDTAVRTSAGGTDIFVARFDTSGAVRWVDRSGGAGEDSVVSIREDIFRGGFIAGRFTGSAAFGDTTLTAGGTGGDIFVAKYSPDGRVLWAHRAGGTGNDAALAMDMDDPSLVLTGSYSNSATFDAITRSGGTDNFYVARFTETRMVSQVTAPDTICAGRTFTTTFEIQGAFGQGNVFTAQLSDASGSFASPVVVGQQPFADIQNIEIMFPYDTPGGSGYRLRVVSSNPARVYPDNGRNFTIKAAPQPTITPNGPTTFCPGTQVLLTASAGYSDYFWSTGERTRSIIVTDPGDYYVYVTGDNACQGLSKTINLKQFPFLFPPQIAQNGNLLRTDSASGYHFEWSLDGNRIDGATASSYLATQSGVYRVTVIDSNGCSAVSEPLTVTISGVSGSDRSERIELLSRSIHDGVLTLDLHLEGASTLDLRVTNVRGEEVRQMRENVAGNQRLSIDLSDQPAGVYFVSIGEKGKAWVQEKIVLP